MAHSLQVRSNSLRRWPALPAFLAAVLLAACGGGGGGGGGGTGGATATPAAVTVGADLSAPPNNTVRCEDGWPVTTTTFANSGQASCMLVSVNSGLSGPRLSAGTVQSATIRVGPITGPMRFVLVRDWAQNTPQGVVTACCSIELASNPFTPQPNTVTTVALGFPFVAEQVPAAGDTTPVYTNRLALEILAPDVPIPGYWVSGLLSGGTNGNLVSDAEFLPSPLVGGNPISTGDIKIAQGTFFGLQPAFNVQIVPK